MDNLPSEATIILYTVYNKDHHLPHANNELQFLPFFCISSFKQTRILLRQKCLICLRGKGEGVHIT